MARKRVTQQKLASGLGLSQAAVSRRLRGDVPFDVAMLSDVADLLGVPVAALTNQVAA
jgi:transcriptional regulator with XRE-family HTH domain